MRDLRFVARRCGGPLDPARHRLLAVWAADCAGRVLSVFEGCVADDRPRHAVAAARAWAGGGITVGQARQAAFAAHAAARAAPNVVAGAAARAAGHAAATAHMADHCLQAALYAQKAVGSADAERSEQVGWLPDEVRELVASALAEDRSARGG